MYNVVIISAEQQSDSVICIHLAILFQILLPFCRFFLKVWFLPLPIYPS